MSDLCDAQAKGYIKRVPHFNAAFKVLESPETSPMSAIADFQERIATASVSLTSRSIHPVSAVPALTAGTTTNSVN